MVTKEMVLGAGQSRRVEPGGQRDL